MSTLSTWKKKLLALSKKYDPFMQIFLSLYTPQRNLFSQVSECLTEKCLLSQLHGLDSCT